MLVTLPLAMLGIALQAQLVAPLPRLPLPRPAAGAVMAVSNGNEASAGVLEGRVLTLSIDVVAAAWSPEGPNDPTVPIFALAETGKVPSVPGPLVRVNQGTTVRLTLRNRTDSALVFNGLRAGSDAASDTVQLAAGEVRDVAFRLDKRGTYWYWGGVRGAQTYADRYWLDSQLNGAIVVDVPNASTRDRILFVSEWFVGYDDRRQAFESAMVVNGKGYPYSKRLVYPQGDSVRFRVINAVSFHHPMHLHGFFYRLEEVGNAVIPPSRQMLSNTDLLPAGSTEVLSFLPTTPGNWLFHCHFAFHVNDEVSLSGSPRDSSAVTSHSPAHDKGEHTMRGLALGIQVTPAAGHVAPSMANARNIHLFVQQQPGRLAGGTPAIGFMAQRGDTVPPTNQVSIPGPVLELERGKPVRITVKNNLTEPTSVHWHGLEIESYPDGVPNWSGLGNHIYTQIAPNDSFVAEFVPPRAGTYPYHSHFNDREQMISGMYGALI